MIIGSPNDNDEEPNDKNLVPCFVFPGKKPNYSSQFEKTVMILESVDISNEDMCLMGNVRVNFAKLQMAAAGRKRVSIGNFSCICMILGGVYKPRGQTRGRGFLR